jgi:hypothetical protein
MLIVLVFASALEMHAIPFASLDFALAVLQATGLVWLVSYAWADQRRLLRRPHPQEANSINRRLPPRRTSVSGG